MKNKIIRNLPLAIMLFFAQPHSCFATEHIDYLPIKVSKNELSFSTRNIPSRLSVTAKCIIRTEGHSCPNPFSYLLISSEEKTLSSIVQVKSYITETTDDEGNVSSTRHAYYEKSGGKFYKQDCSDCYFFFYINRVTSEHKEILVSIKNEWQHSLTGYCFY